MKKPVYGTLAVIIGMWCAGARAPEPAVVQGPTEWTFKVDYEHPQMLELRGYRGDGVRRFWYVIMTLTNKTGEEVGFHPNCQLVTDTFQVIDSGTEVPPAAFRQIKERHRQDYPLLDRLEDVGSQMLTGEDNAKTVAVIWPDFDPEANGIRIFITGLSNETAVVDPPGDEAEPVYLRKTLELEYSVGGDPAYRGSTRLRFEGKDWVMR
jgi:hypothetical protein